MTPLQLRHLLAIVEHGSLGRAAAHLHISEPALSRSLRSLEAELGVPLMDRHASGMKPTIFGAALTDHARIIRTEFSRAILHLRELQGASHGQVAIGASHSFATSLLPRASVRLLERRPGIRLAVTQGLFPALVPMLLRAELDFLLLPLPEDPPSDDLARIVLRTERSSVFVRAGHPLARLPGIDLDQLGSSAWMLPNPGDRTRIWTEERFAQLGLGPVTPAIEFNSVAYAREMLLATDLLAALPLEVMRRDLQEGRLVELPIPELQWKRQAGILHRAGNTLTPAALALIEELQLLAKAAQTD